MIKKSRLLFFFALVFFLFLSLIGNLYLVWKEYERFYYFVVNEETLRVASVVKGTLSAGGDPVEALENYMKESPFLRGVSYKLGGRDIFLPDSYISPEFISKTVEIPPFSFTLYYDVSYLSRFKKHLFLLTLLLSILSSLFVGAFFFLLREYYLEKLKRIDERNRRKNLEAVNLAVHSIVHEVKNRLNVMRLLLYRHNSTNSPIYMDKIKEELGNLSRYIEETSDLRKPLRLKLELNDIEEVVKSAVKELEEFFSVKGIEIFLSVKKFQFEFDERRVSSALLDILKNASEALESFEGGKKELKIIGKRKGKNYILEVWDNSPLDLPKGIFEPFFSTKENGFGIGLYNVKRIVEAHGGSVKAEKRGGWTVFSLEFPIV